ncbi:hypothetical protein [Rhodococcus sp. MEB032]|uniref:hypothetical protein n=1 Tax=Rhodococcus sp. MEB032 TaxID=3040322 RepID=UPI002550D1F9|nr:hypothetical protein [Rhodococcus sp. MEB032]
MTDNTMCKVQRILLALNDDEDSKVVNTLRGTRSPRFAVRHNGVVKSFRQATGPGTILLIHASYRSVYDRDSLYESLLDKTDIEVVTVGDFGAPDLIDFESQWVSWFAKHEAAAILVLPDHDIYCAVNALAKIPDLVRAYRDEFRRAGRF